MEMNTLMKVSPKILTWEICKRKIIVFVWKSEWEFKYWTLLLQVRLTRAAAGAI